MAKLRLVNNNTVIGRYYRGVPHGLRRTFGTNGNLIRIQNYDNGYKVGYSWRYDHGNTLIFAKKDQLDAGEAAAALFIVNRTLVATGRHEQHVHVLEDLAAATITQVQVPEKECMILDSISWQAGRKLPFRFWMKLNMTFPTTYEEQDYCRSEYKPPQLRLFSLEQDRHTRFLFGAQYPLYYMRLETSETDEKTAGSKLIGNPISVDLKSSLFSADILGQPRNVRSERFFLDNRGRLHGIQLLTLLDESLPDVPWHSRNVSLAGIEGRFVHGELQGLVKLFLVGGIQAYAEVRNGWLHGGLISHGQRPIIAPVSERMVQSMMQ